MKIGKSVDYDRWILSWSERPGVTPGETWSREQADPIDASLADAGSYALSRYLICAGISLDSAGADEPGSHGSVSCRRLCRKRSPGSPGISMR